MKSIDVFIKIKVLHENQPKIKLTFQQLDGSVGSRRRQETSSCKLGSKQRSFSVNPDGRVPESEAYRSGDSIL